MFLENKILGCLVGAATGDAMGAPTELRTRSQIEEKFNGYVREFLTPPNDTFAKGGKAGEVTDDFSLAYTTVETIIKNNGLINEEVGRESLLAWSDSKYFERFAGPTTRAAIHKMKGLKLPGPELFIPVNDNFKTTNGVGMKISPISLFSNGDVDKAIENAITIGKVTHDNDKSLSAGAAIAAATAEAMNEQASLISVVNAGLYGAIKGEKIAREVSNTYAGPSVVERMKLAIEIGHRAENLSEAIDELSDLVGSGLLAAEAIPCVFGLMIAAKGDTAEAIYAGVNIGNDTDTVATMIGGILGTLNGVDSLPKEYKELLESRNNYDFDEMTKSIVGIINEK